MKRLWTVALAILGATAVLSSCTSENKNAMQARNVFQYNLRGEPTTLNPVTRTDNYSGILSGYIMDSLITRDLDTYEWVPLLAESYEVGEDGQTFTFKLRKDAKFHDGKPVTPEDVKFSLEVYFIDEYGAFHRRPYYESIEDINIVDESTITVTTNNRYFKNLETIGGAQIIPKHVYGNVEEGKKLNNTMIGSGPYKVKKYERGQMIVLEKNKDWIGNKLDHFAGQHNYEEMVFKFPKEDTVGLQMLKRGQLDYMGLSAEQYEDQTKGPEWEKSIDKYKVENKAPKGTSFVAWNFKKPLFQSRKTRLALYHLMNREQMNDNFAFGLNQLATGPWYTANPAADPSVEPVLFDVEKAKKLLTEDGWSDSDKDGVLDKEFDGQRKKFEFTLMYPNKDYEKYWVLYQNDLKTAGIQMKLQLLEWNSFIGRIDSQDFDSAALAWSGVVHYDPKQIWHSSSAVVGGSNFISYKNPVVDELIEKARVELDDEKRIKMLQQVYKLVAEDVPYAFMFNPRYALYATTPRVEKDKETLTYDLGVSHWRLDTPEIAAE